MNARTSKLLHHYATANQLSERMLKRVWLKMPWTKRAEHRRELKRLLTAIG